MTTRISWVHVFLARLASIAITKKRSRFCTDNLPESERAVPLLVSGLCRSGGITAAYNSGQKIIPEYRGEYYNYGSINLYNGV